MVVVKQVRFALVAFAFVAAVLVSGKAKADAADPVLGYAFAQYALPYHASFLTKELDDGTRQSGHEVGRRQTVFGLQSLGAGFGIGYSGLNAQLDFRNASDITTGAITVGLRERIAIGRFELWGRAGIGPAIVFDNTQHKVKTTGAIATSLEAGADYFIVNQRLALGLKALATPQYHFPSDFFADFGLNIGLRLIL